MFDWVQDALNYIQDLFYGMIEFLLDLAQGLADTIGLKACWDMLKNIMGGSGGGSPVDVLMNLVPIAQKLAHWDIIFNLVHCQFSILAALCAFKIAVKLIPTIW
jgi:hypothetical protein